MPHVNKFSKNPRLLFWSRALVEFKTLNVVAVLFYLHRGLGIDEVFYLSIFFAVTSLLFEIPSGYLADRIGRKKTLLLGTLFFILTYVSYLSVQGFWWFAIPFVFSAIGYACFSGTEEALLYDSLKEMGKEGEMNRFNGKMHAAKHFMKMFTPLLGALIARELLEWQFQLLIVIDILAMTTSLVLVLFIQEPDHKRDVLAEEIGVYRESLRTIRQSPFLFRAAMNNAMIFLISFVVWRMYQPYLFDRGVTIFWLGIFYAALQMFLFSSKWLVGVLDERFGTSSLLFWTNAIVFGSLLLLLFGGPAWWVFLLLICAITFASVRSPIFSHGMNQRITSRSRSTTLSNLNIFIAILEVPLMLASGALAAAHIEFIFLLCLFMSLSVFMFFPVRHEDFVPAFEENELVP